MARAIGTHNNYNISIHYYYLLFLFVHLFYFTRPHHQSERLKKKQTYVVCEGVSRSNIDLGAWTICTHLPNSHVFSNSDLWHMCDKQTSLASSHDKPAVRLIKTKTVLAWWLKKRISILASFITTARQFHLVRHSQSAKMSNSWGMKSSLGL